jgi:putative transposase
MPATQRIYDQNRDAHFITITCSHRRKLLDHPHCKGIVIGNLAKQLAQRQGKCAGFVVMPEHVHVLVWFGIEGQVTEFVSHWKRLSSFALRKFYKQTLTGYAANLPDEDSLWVEGLYDFNVQSEEKLREKLEYMHLNPVRRGLVERAIDWPWSSARHYELGKSVGIKIEWIA